MDISFNQVKIDFSELYEVCQIATGYTKTEVERNLSELQHDLIYNKGKRAHYIAENLERNAKALAKAFAVRHALEESATREILEVTNKPS